MKNTRLVAGLAVAQICAMAGFAPFASLLVELSHLWHLDPTRAGWISSAYLIGYAIAVPALVGMTDRVDARAIYVTGCALGVVGGVGFAWLAHGFASAFVFRAIAGMALAGTYMPGLRILTERLEPHTRIRSVPYYTAMFGVGVSVSFWMSGWMAQRYGWPGAFWASAAGSAAAVTLSLAIGMCVVVTGRLSFAAAVVMLFAYAAAISADSGALTAGAVAVARSGEQGATLAVYSLVGFAGGALGPLGAGVALGLGGGLKATTAWYLAFAAVAAGSAVTAVAISLAPRARHAPAAAAGVQDSSLRSG